MGLLVTVNLDFSLTVMLSKAKHPAGKKEIGGDMSI